MGILKEMQEFLQKLSSQEIDLFDERIKKTAISARLERELDLLKKDWDRAKRIQENPHYQVGNFVRRNKDNGSTYIGSIYKIIGFVHSMVKIQRVAESDYIGFSKITDLMPIPLDTDTLLRFTGYWSSSGGSRYFFKIPNKTAALVIKSYVNEDNGTVVYTPGIYANGTSVFSDRTIKYVHEFQNVYLQIMGVPVEEKGYLDLINLRNEKAKTDNDECTIPPTAGRKIKGIVTKTNGDEFFLDDTNEDDEDTEEYDS